MFILLKLEISSHPYRSPLSYLIKGGSSQISLAYVLCFILFVLYYCDSVEGIAFLKNSMSIW